MPSHADTISAALRERVAANALCVGAAGRNFTHAAKVVSQASDVVDVMRAAVEVMVAAETLREEADAAVKVARAALTEAMESSGCTSIQAEHHRAHLARRPPFLSISDEASIPRSFYVQPPEQLDKRAIISAIKDGTEVPGASLATPNAMSLVLRAKKETAS
jgi:hypothetical protein